MEEKTEVNDDYIICPFLHSARPGKAFRPSALLSNIFLYQIALASIHWINLMNGIRVFTGKEMKRGRNSREGERRKKMLRQEEFPKLQTDKTLKEQ